MAAGIRVEKMANKDIKKETKKPKKKDAKAVNRIDEGEAYNPAAVEVVRKPRKQAEG